MKICVFLFRFLVDDSLPGVPKVPSCSIPCSLSLGMSIPDALSSWLEREGAVWTPDTARSPCLPEEGREALLQASLNSQPHSRSTRLKAA